MFGTLEDASGGGTNGHTITFRVYRQPEAGGAAVQIGSNLVFTKGTDAAGAVKTQDVSPEVTLTAKDSIYVEVQAKDANPVLKKFSIGIVGYTNPQ